jgi:undecaprenyl-diphosphatase
MNYIQAIILGGLQGITELFPISSLGHTVLIPSLLGWQLDQGGEFFVLFLVATHFATALVLLGFFFRDWVALAKGFFRSLVQMRLPEGDTHARIAWLLIIGTVPAGAIGLIFQKKFEALFAAPATVALFLIANGFLLYGAEVLRRRRSIPEHGDPDNAIAKLSYVQAAGVGVMQALALFPGFSRTGAALSGGLLAKLDHASAARFSFLLATPIIFAAAALKLPKLFHMSGFEAGPILVGALVSGICAFLSVHFLTKYFKSNTLTPFAMYCVAAGICAFLFLH